LISHLARGADERQANAAARSFWLVADDYGISPGVNAAIRELAIQKRLNATSVMVVAPSFTEPEIQALAAAKQRNESLAIGLHLTLTAPFKPLTADFEPLDAGVFPSHGRLMAASFLRRLDEEKLEAEVNAQLVSFAAAFGDAPAFIDGHRHVHLLPQVRDAVVRVVKKGAPNAWIRQCGRGLPLWRLASKPKAAFIDWLSRGLVRLAAAERVPTNPAFAGAYEYWAGADYAALFPHFLASLPEGGVVMCHPGFVDAELRGLDPLTTLREQEHRFLAGESFPRILAQHDLTLEPRGKRLGEG
jgi:predicted glycoside hydrolase/deacetylase ChbG (UPF0249 family)